MAVLVSNCMNQVIQPVSVAKLHNSVKAGRDHPKMERDSPGGSGMLVRPRISLWPLVPRELGARGMGSRVLGPGQRLVRIRPSAEILFLNVLDLREQDQSRPQLLSVLLAVSCHPSVLPGICHPVNTAILPIILPHAGDKMHPILHIQPPLSPVT